jgi:hypothetical protein
MGWDGKKQNRPENFEKYRRSGMGCQTGKKKMGNSRGKFFAFAVMIFGNAFLKRI